MAALCVGSDYCEFSRERGRGRRGRKEERPGREEKEEGGGVASLGISRGTPRWPGRQAGGGHGGHLGASTQVLHEEDK
jgi:hypothetical protein